MTGSTTMIRTCWELLHPFTGDTLGREWIDRDATAVNPPPPQWIRVPVVRILSLIPTLVAASNRDNGHDC